MKELTIGIWVILIYSNVIHYFAEKGLLAIYPRHIVYLGLVLFAVGFLRREIKVRKSYTSFIYTCLFGIGMTTLYYAFTLITDAPVDRSTALDEFGIVNFYMVCVVFIICNSSVSSHNFTRYLLTLVFFVGLLLNIYDFVLNDPDTFSATPGRANGLYFHPNIAAIVLTISYVVLHRDIPNYLRIFVFILFAMAVGFTGSRAGQLYIVIIFLFQLFSRYYFSFDRKTMLVNLSIVLVLAVNWVYIEDSFQHITSEISDQSTKFENRYKHFLSLLSGEEEEERVDDSAGDGRYGILLKHSNAYLDSPVFGNGLGFSRSERLSGTWAASHNIYIHMLNEYGLFGLLFYLYFIFQAIGKPALTSKAGCYEPHLLLSLILLMGFFSHNLNRYYAVALLLSYAGAKYRLQLAGVRRS